MRKTYGIGCGSLPPRHWMGFTYSQPSFKNIDGYIILLAELTDDLFPLKVLSASEFDVVQDIFQRHHHVGQVSCGHCVVTTLDEIGSRVCHEGKLLAAFEDAAVDNVTSARVFLQHGYLAKQGDGALESIDWRTNDERT